MPSPFDKTFSRDNQNNRVDFGKMNDNDRINIGASMGGGIGFEAGGPAGALIGAAFGANIANGVKAARDGSAELSNRKLGISSFFKNLGFDGFDVYKDLDNFSPNPLNGQTKRKSDEIDRTHPLSSVSEPISRALASIVGRGNMGYIDSENDLDMKALDAASGMISNHIQNGARTPKDVVKNARDIAKKLNVDQKAMSNHASTTSMSEEEKRKIMQGIQSIFGE